MEQVPAGARCPTCGAVRPPDAPGGLCPACLLGVAAEPDGASSGGDATRLTTNQPVRLERATGAEGSDDLTRISQDRPSPPDAASARVVPVPGQPFGPYLVTRLLGRGGMGEVYEVEQRDTGRRLALKVLRGRIGGAENRARFLREGQLAASVSHPHTVYIYGSEEIAGAPVIAMELLSGGTLQDRVTEGGPMPVADAVRAVLEIIGGLDAAQAAGILHRDIKPSNCFTDADGGVKVGDFGLSISTLARDVGAGVTTQGFEGTPQFAAPEQLRGEPLDVRADIYAVGATLYYLLTGQPPFQAHDLRELVALVTTAPPPSPRVKAPQVPAPLAQVVMRCLAKDPADRPSSYAALAEQLRPFATTPAVPAGLGSRLLAGVIDAVIIGAPINMITSSQTRAMPSGFQASIDTAAIWSLIAGALYFLILEGRWAASLGKRLLGLRVISARGSLTWKQVAIRTVLYYSPSSPTLLATLLVGAPALTVWLNAHPLWAVLFAISNFILLGCLFLTARARNGRAAIHDLASGTRVVVSAAATRLTGRGTVGPTPDAAASRAKMRIGPFEADATVPAADGTMLAEGFDPVLRRRVWIHVVRPGTPPLDPVRRDTGRPGRLRWLTGRRDEGGQWDAFEAPDGMPLDAIARASATWAVAKRWLVDLAAELQESAAEGSMPVLALDRVWIRADDRAVLLDFPVPTTMLGPAPAPAASARPLTDPMAFLAAVTARVDECLTRDPRRRGPIGAPLSALALLRQWAAGRLPASLSDAHAALAAAASTPDDLPRLRRAVPIGLAALPIALAMAGGLALAPIFRQIVSLPLFEITQLLPKVAAADAGRGDAAAQAYAEQIELYLAGSYARELTDPSIWNNRGIRALASLRATAARIVEAHPSVTAAELERARSVLHSELQTIAAAYQKQGPALARAEQTAAAALLAVAMSFALAVSLISAMAVPGGLVARLIGLAVVDRDDREIGRVRSIARVLIAWSPFIVMALALGGSPLNRLQASPIPPLIVAGVPIALLAAGAVWTILRPERGPHDVVAGTWMVLR